MCEFMRKFTTACFNFCPFARLGVFLLSLLNLVGLFGGLCTCNMCCMWKECPPEGFGGQVPTFWCEPQRIVLMM